MNAASGDQADFGLRGGISIALALSLPAGAMRDLILAATYMVVLFSVLAQGATIEGLVRRSARRVSPRTD